MPKYYPINEETARRAKNANSFSDYVPGSATAAYREMVDRAYTLGKQQKGRVDPMYHEKIDGLIDRYARKLAENINQCNLIDARVPSILIAGGSNFPVRKKEKQNAARDKNMGEYMQIEGLLDKVRSTGMGGISADDDRAVEKLEAKLAGLEAMQEEMKTVNAYYRKHKTLEGCPVLSAEEIGKLQSSMASDWRKNPVPYPSYLLTNNNANIRRTRQRIEDLKSQSEYAGWAFPGGRAEINEGENRLQLFFEEKPSEEQRRELKSKGPAYERWAKVYNLKQMAAALQYLRENDLMDYEALAASTEKAVERFHTLSEELRQTEAELEKTFGLMAATVDYAKTRPVFDGYKAARYSKKYLSEHEAELAAYRAARVTMNELLDGAKLPKMADMKKSRQELAGKKKALYAEYRKAQADMRQAVAVKANIDHLLGVTDGRGNKAQER